MADADKSDLARLRAMLGDDEEVLRQDRVRALSDEELARAVQLLGDTSILRNVTVLDDLRSECARRGIVSTERH